MNLQQHIHVLRLHVLDMTRLAQRSVDYSVKACALGSPEMCSAVRDRTFEIDALHCEIAETAQELLASNIPCDRDLRFVLSCERIGIALQFLHLQADEIASQCLQLLELGRTVRCAEIAAMGEIVNSLVRLCAVALFEEEKQHADLVLSAGRVERLFEMTFCAWLRSLDRAEREQSECDRVITRHLSRMARQTYEIADALDFWLEVPDIEAKSDMEGRRQALCWDDIPRENADCDRLLRDEFVA
jgi:phosphate uptake regulator